jgi:hypothetical protein
MDRKVRRSLSPSATSNSPVGLAPKLDTIQPV